MKKRIKILAIVGSLLILVTISPSKALAQYVGEEIVPDSYTIILEHLNGSTVGEVNGLLDYVTSLPNMNLAGDFQIGTYIIYQLNTSLRSQGTIELWINPHTYYMRLVNFNWRYTHSYPPAGHVLHLNVLDDGKIQYGAWASGGLTSNSTIPLNEWTHVAVSWGSAGTKIYINGELDAWTPIGYGPHTWAGNWIYLHYWGIPGLGYFDEFHVSRIQRTDEEISSRVIRQVQVAVDIKPGSCPNPLNVKSKGVLPVAVLGTEDFDVTDIDPETIILTREGYEDVGASPLRWSYEDVATPFEGEFCNCHDLNGDGYLDLTLKFKTQELVKTLWLDLEEIAGETIPLILTGNLKEEEGSTPIKGSDCIKILKTGKK